jgi:hypothetical protein
MQQWDQQINAIAKSAVRAFLEAVGRRYATKMPVLTSPDTTEPSRDHFAQSCAICGEQEAGLVEGYLIPLDRRHLGLGHPGNRVPLCQKCHAGLSSYASGWEAYLRIRYSAPAGLKEYYRRRQAIREHVLIQQYPLLSPNEQGHLRKTANELYHRIQHEITKSIGMYEARVEGWLDESQELESTESLQSDGPRLYENRFAADLQRVALHPPVCHCLDAQDGKESWQELSFHTEPQDTSSPAWYRLLELVDETAAAGYEEFAPGRVLAPRDWMQVVTLPSTIAKLKSVKRLNLYGSNLLRLPPQIGEMSSLEEFVPYTSYRLHWFPYEIRQCTNLKSSKVSTRAVYGNYKYRPPFPRLPKLSPEMMPERCSICNGSFRDSQPLQRWISLQVATDVLPLLVHACSEECLENLPNPPEGYVGRPHQGGLDLEQPQTYY